MEKIGKKVLEMIQKELLSIDKLVGKLDGEIRKRKQYEKVLEKYINTVRAARNNDNVAANVNIPLEPSDKMDIAKANNSDYKLIVDLKDKRIKLIQTHAKLVTPLLSDMGKEDKVDNETGLSEDVISKITKAVEEENKKKMYEI